MRRALLSFLVALVCSSAAYANSYLCIGDAAGGLKFLDGAWRGTSFKSGSKFLVARSPENSKHWTVTEIGDPFPSHRCTMNTGPDGIDSEQLVCGGLGYGMIINFSKLRFTQVYTIGFIEDDRSGENTPFVSGGLCSKIN